MVDGRMQNGMTDNSVSHNSYAEKDKMRETGITAVTTNQVRNPIISCCRWIIPIFIVGIAVVWGVLSGDFDSVQDQLVKQQRLENPIPPPPGYNPQCDSSTLTTMDQHHCHIAEATLRYEEWRNAMESNDPNSREFRSLVRPHSNAFAYHVESAIEILSLDQRVKDTSLFQLQFNFSVWAARLQIEADPRANSTKYWMPLIKQYAKAPAIIGKMMIATNNPKLHQNLTASVPVVSTEDVNLAIRHYMNLAKALCEPELQLPHSQSLEKLHESVLRMLIDKRHKNLNRLVPLSRMPPDSVSIVLRTAMEMWIRAQLLLLGVPLEEIVNFDFRGYSLETQTVSSEQLLQDLEQYNARIPTCLFRPAAVSGKAANSGTKLDGPVLLRGPRVRLSAGGELDDHQTLLLSQFDWQPQTGQKLLRAESRTPNEIGTLKFVRATSARMKKERPDDLKITGEGNRTVEWLVPSSADWMGVQADLNLHSGSFQLNFAIDSLQNNQLGVGFLLAWQSWPDWGFKGYLGSSASAWAYDPYDGGIVFDADSIAVDLPKLDPSATEDAGIITLQLDLPRGSNGRAQFLVNGRPTPAFLLPRSAVVIPAVCLLKQGQRVRLLSLDQQPVSDESIKNIDKEAKRLRAKWDANPNARKEPNTDPRW